LNKARKHFFFEKRSKKLLRNSGRDANRPTPVGRKSEAPSDIFRHQGNPLQIPRDL
jgi:hypothetical protein